MNKDIKKKGFIGIFLILLLSPFAIKAEESDKNSNSRLPVKEINNFTQVFEQIRTGYVEEITDVPFGERDPRNAGELGSSFCVLKR